MTRICLLLLLCLIPSTLLAAPKDEMVAFVPKNHHFGIFLQDADTQLQRIAASPLGKSIIGSMPPKSWVESRDWEALQGIEKFVSQLFGHSFQEIASELLGTGAIVVFRDANESQKEGDGLVLLWVKRPQVVQQWIQKVNAFQGVKVRSEVIQPGFSMMIRETATGKDGYFLVGNILGMSSSLPLLRDSLDTAATPSRQIPKQWIERLGATDAIFGTWLLPRAFDAQIAQQIATARESERATLETLGRYWQGVDAIGLFLRLQPEPELVGTIVGRSEDVPNGGPQFLASFLPAVPLWANRPNDVLLELNSGFRWESIAALADELMPGEAAKKWRDGLQKELAPIFGRQGWSEVLASIGPRWGLRVRSLPDRAIPSICLAIELSGGEQSDAVMNQLMPTLQYLATSLRISYNRTHPDRDQVITRTIRHEKLEIMTFQNEVGFPEGFRPGYALKDGYLVIGESPETIIDFQATRGDTGSRDSEHVLGLFALEAMRNHLKQHRKELPAWLAPAAANPASGESLETVLNDLAGIRQVELGTRVTSQRGELFLRIRPTLSIASPTKPTNPSR
ncbi:hypothetical protein [Tuwongella immobilis]|uniref:DUF3352 domain-containing protein n=1 Tax=Tuwongella immobilis TaxID=692036 RepID=A0A6C2YNR6_9BACT|nr:hypothetical protein [Tuwongella immobilis]VIP03034.1 unnamed protein product [Tuwongella immobilis]VTS03190.1 unnamed protein product [Tuwongella immobilis]